MNNKIVLIVLTAVIVGGAAFFGGMKYGESAGSQMANIQGVRDRGFGGGNASSTFGRRGGMGLPGQGGFTGGQIIAKDDKSITVQLMGGGSKIIFFSGSTMIMKSATGTPDDLAVGAQVVATGSANSDGSVTASSLQLRSGMMSQPNTQ